MSNALCKQSNPKINTHNTPKKTTNHERERESRCSIPGRSATGVEKKRELSYFLLKNNTFIHRLPQSGPRKETPSLSRLTFPATRNHMGRPILEIQAAYNRKKGAASSEESQRLASKIAGTLHPRGRFLSLARVAVKRDPRRGRIPTSAS